MAYRDIAVCVSSLEPDHHLISQAAELADTWGAHLNCCGMSIEAVPVFTDGFVGTPSSIAVQIEANEKANKAFRNDLGLFLQEKHPSTEFRQTRNFVSNLAAVTSFFARYADVIIARMPGRPDKAHHAEIIEGALFGGGRPVLALPADWKPAPLGRHVLLAWDASRQASRAIHDVLPMLQDAAEVCVVTVDAQTGPKQHGDVPGLDIAVHLARHGLRITVRNEDSLGKPVGERLVESAKGFDADMIVMGAYRHSKLAQRLVEGPSQFLIAKSPLPVFLSH